MATESRASEKTRSFLFFSHFSSCFFWFFKPQTRPDHGHQPPPPAAVIDDGVVVVDAVVAVVAVVAEGGRGRTGGR